MTLTKSNNNVYIMRHESEILFQGGRKAATAYAHWNHGISKEDMSKALDLLDNKALKIFFDVNNKIMLDNGPEIA